MSLKTPDQATIADTVLFDLLTTDLNGNLVDPYEVNRVTILFVERDYSAKQYLSSDEYVGTENTQFIYKDAVPIKIFGDDDFPAWLSTDTADALISRVSVGHFQLQWTPELARAGDYFLCYSWTVYPAGDTYIQTFYFKLTEDKNPPSPPSHLTPPKKYEILLERYLPEMFKMYLGSSDLTPNVLERLNKAVAMGFTDLEDLGNQLLDTNDANIIKNIFLPYMANFFRWKLRSQDTVLWRRQCRRAIPMYKRKGTLGGLQEALSSSGIKFKKLTHYWQVVSPATWQEGFVYNDNCTFQLAKNALLPIDLNFDVSYRKQNTFDYVDVLSSSYTFTNHSDANDNCPPDTDDYTTLTLADDICGLLDVGDIVKVIYKVAVPVNQTLETYIQSLPLADNRDEVLVTYPVKNWNIRLISEDDVLFDSICPQQHPFQYPVIWGKVRNEFPYGENIYNMDEYNSSIRDSEDPCSIDASFYDTCSCCRSSKVSIDVEIEELSDDRVTETEEIINDFLPFHSPLQSINYVGFRDELILSPIEEIECLIRYVIDDNVITSQFNFNRDIEDGKSYVGELERDELATFSTVASGTDGFGVNLNVFMYSYGYNFSVMGIGPNNILEILSGSNIGNYSLTPQGNVLGLSSPSPSGFVYRLSNIAFSESVNVFQDNIVNFTSQEAFEILPIPDDGTWLLRINSGPYVGSYPILSISPEKLLKLSGWTNSAAVSLNYSIIAPGNINVLSGSSGVINVRNVGRLETSMIEGEYGVGHGDYVSIGGVQYQIISVGGNDFYIDGWVGGNVNVSYFALKRLVDNGYGFVNFKGMKLTTTANYESVLGIQNGVNAVASPVEGSDFKENYLVLIGSQYFRLANIDGQNMYISGPVLSWGLSGTSNISYSLIHFDKVPVVTQDGTHFDFIDRRGEESLTITQINS